MDLRMCVHTRTRTLASTHALAARDVGSFRLAGSADSPFVGEAALRAQAQTATSGPDAPARKPMRAKARRAGTASLVPGGAPASAGAAEPRSAVSYPCDPN